MTTEDADRQNSALMAAYTTGFDDAREVVLCRKNVFCGWPYHTAPINTPAVAYYITMRTLERYPELLLLSRFSHLIPSNQKVKE